MTEPDATRPDVGRTDVSEAAAPAGAGSRGLGQRAARGAFVTLGGQAARIVLQLVSVVVLARLLDPHDYGILAMVLAVIGVGEIFRDFGLSNAAVQAKSLSTGQRDNLFWTNAGIGLVLAAIAFAISVPLAALYGEPALVDVTRVLAVTFLLNGLATQFRADLVRRLQFRRLAVVDVTAPAVGLTLAALAALSGWGLWALVAQQVAQSLVLLLGLVAAARWLPGRPRRGEPMAGLLRFGWDMVGSQLVGYAANNVDSLLIGVRFGAGPLGVYNRAFQLLMSPLTQLRAPSTTVALPVLSRLADEPRRYGEFVRRGQLALGYSLVAGLGFVVGAAEPITDLFLGARWEAVTPLLRLLAVAGACQTLAYVGYWVYLSRGLTRALLRYSLVAALIKITCVAVGSLWGVQGTAAGYALAAAIEWPLSLAWLSRLTPAYPGRALALGALRILAMSAAGALAGAGVTTAMAGAPAVLQVLAAAGSTVVVYAVATALVPAVRSDIRGVLDVARLATRRTVPA
ncbi:lipopolysaccharide biosynthesis protein [Cellulomonas aerilata]|uniref:Lipopolysaccharide biosynthesis protein n=1 Tax=Cellulomonas aerilata TaxID=515326 RepID=A0A512DDU1_9CELL|nr:lipopolysaccharide biosynthesis protein [Cellulomonas aerilata]GEO34638.1 lipopolysaccharide biosynthesis protein [Cellulomonas aerilata]